MNPQRTMPLYDNYPPLPDTTDPLAFTYTRTPDDDGATVYTSRIPELGLEFTIDVWEIGRASCRERV